MYEVLYDLEIPNFVFKSDDKNSTCLTSITGQSDCPGRVEDNRLGSIPYAVCAGTDIHLLKSNNY